MSAVIGIRISPVSSRPDYRRSSIARPGTWRAGPMRTQPNSLRTPGWPARCRCCRAWRPAHRRAAWRCIRRVPALPPRRERASSNTPPDQSVSLSIPVRAAQQRRFGACHAMRIPARRRARRPTVVGKLANQSKVTARRCGETRSKGRPCKPVHTGPYGIRLHTMAGQTSRIGRPLSVKSLAP